MGSLWFKYPQFDLVSTGIESFGKLEKVFRREEVEMPIFLSGSLASKPPAVLTQSHGRLGPAVISQDRTVGSMRNRAKDRSDCSSTTEDHLLCHGFTGSGIVQDRQYNASRVWTMKTEGSVVIDRPIDEVFEYTNNNVTEWSLIVLEEEVLEETPDRVGTTFRTVTEDHGRQMEFDGVTTKYDPPHVSAIHLEGSSFNIDAEYQFEDLGGKTRVTQRSSVKGKGLFALMLPLMSVFMRKSSCDALQKELNNLKRCLESP